MQRSEKGFLDPVSRAARHLNFRVEGSKLIATMRKDSYYFDDKYRAFAYLTDDLRDEAPKTALCMDFYIKYMSMPVKIGG